MKLILTVFLFLAAFSQSVFAVAQRTPFRHYRAACNELRKLERDKFSKDEVPLGLGNEFEEIEPISISSESAAEHFRKDPPLLQSQQPALMPADFPYRQFINTLVESGHNLWRQEGSVEPAKWISFLREYEFVRGFTYSGYLLSPQMIRSNGGGILPRFLQERLEPNNPDSCVNLLNAAKPFLDPISHFKSPASGAYFSTSRSFSVAMVFAGKYSIVAKQDAYIYLSYVDAGIDMRDVTYSTVGNSVNNREREIFLPGSFRWNSVVAYRKVSPSARKPGFIVPEFSGPIFVRKGMKEREVDVYQRLIRDFSTSQRDLEEVLQKTGDLQSIQNE